MPYDTQLIAFLLGLLDETGHQAIAQERLFSPDVAAKLRTLEEVLGQVALTAEPVSPSPHLRGRLMASLEPATRFAGFEERLATFFNLELDQTRAVLHAIPTIPEPPWQASGIPNVSLLPVEGGPRVATADCGLLYMQSGSLFPAHRHKGDEWGFVLQGSAQEDSGRIWQAGDHAYNPAGSRHSFRILGDEPCVLAVVLHEGLEIITGQAT